MEKVKIYKVNCSKAFMASLELGTRYSLEPWGKNTPYYEGEDDGGREYLLPEGFEVTNQKDNGPLAIYHEGEYCPLVTTPQGPAIAVGFETINLKEA